MWSAHARGAVGLRQQHTLLHFKGMWIATSSNRFLNKSVPLCSRGNSEPLTAPVYFNYSKQDFLKHSLQHLGRLKVQKELGIQVQSGSSLFLIPSLWGKTCLWKRSIVTSGSIFTVQSFRFKQTESNGSLNFLYLFKQFYVGVVWRGLVTLGCFFSSLS